MSVSTHTLISLLSENEARAQDAVAALSNSPEQSLDLALTIETICYPYFKPVVRRAACQNFANFALNYPWPSASVLLDALPMLLWRLERAGDTLQLVTREISLMLEAMICIRRNIPPRACDASVEMPRVLALVENERWQKGDSILYQLLLSLYSCYIPVDQAANIDQISVREKLQEVSADSPSDSGVAAHTKRLLEDADETELDENALQSFASLTEAQKRGLFYRMSKSREKGEVPYHGIRAVFSKGKLQDVCRLLSFLAPFMDIAEAEVLSEVRSYSDRFESHYDFRLAHYYLKCSGTYRPTDEKFPIPQSLLEWGQKEYRYFELPTATLTEGQDCLLRVAESADLGGIGLPLAVRAIHLLVNPYSLTSSPKRLNYLPPLVALALDKLLKGEHEVLATVAALCLGQRHSIDLHRETLEELANSGGELSRLAASKALRQHIITA